MTTEEEELWGDIILRKYNNWSSRISNFFSIPCKIMKTPTDYDYNYSVELKDKIQLFAYEKGDLDSLICLSYLKALKYDYDVNYEVEPLKSPNDCLPYSVFPSSEVRCGYEGIISYLEEERGGKIMQLHDKAYSSLLDDIRLAIVEVFFNSLNNFRCISYLYLPPPNAIPLNFISRRWLSLNYRNEQIKWRNECLSYSYPSKENIIDAYKNVLKILDCKLLECEKKFIFGNEISLFDILLYSHLTFIIKMSAQITEEGDHSFSLVKIFDSYKRLNVWYEEMIRQLEK
jgi:hypothetical protein